jgi:hypothetical protein
MRYALSQSNSSGIINDINYKKKLNPENIFMMIFFAWIIIIILPANNSKQ